jgi:hypothetical protein
MECDDFQFALWLNWFQYKKQKTYRVLAVKCHLIFAFHFLKIKS